MYTNNANMELYRDDGLAACRLTSSLSRSHYTDTDPSSYGARTVLGCVSNPRPLGHGAKPLPTELSRPHSNS
ncbi:hypothetical protein ElyMa_004890000 [Elysia marginata]|uniref:Uncharacterized protein n=1 Tax=Elysia marginata TaxID=1093978 RepID=A0AAV4IT10_9GAST|nr:hypothetical protein ElyMa_004890000 [Elysia marginata]